MYEKTFVATLLLPYLCFLNPRRPDRDPTIMGKNDLESIKKTNVCQKCANNFQNGVPTTTPNR